jgi:hypothetical protein
MKPGNLIETFYAKRDVNRPNAVEAIILDPSEMEGSGGGNIILWARSPDKTIVGKVLPSDDWYNASEDWNRLGLQYCRSVGATYFVGFDRNDEVCVQPIAMIGM